MPPKLSLSGQPHPADEAWHRPPQGRYYGDRPPVGSMPSTGSGFKKHPEIGPMAVQQQQQGREPQLQRLDPQRNSGVRKEPQTFSEGNEHFG